MHIVINLGELCNERLSRASSSPISVGETLSSCILYLDSSGDPGWPPPFGKSKLTWYVLAGLALSPEADHQAHIEVDKILEKYVPYNERKKWPPKDYEIHYHDIIRGKKIFSHLQHPERKALSDEIFALLLKLKPTLFATAIEKTKHKQKYGLHADNPRSLALRATVHRYSMYLNRHSLLGSVVLDEEEYRKDKELQKMTHEFRRYGIILRGWNYQPRYEDKLDRVLNTITFAPSEMSPGIQLADVCSRATWTHFESGKSNRFNQIAPLWNRDQNRVYEPSVIPK